MAKDPAMLWYWGDWHSGTALYSRFLKGCYIDILHAQFNNGRLSLEEIKTCLGADFGSSWPTLQKKFKQDETGLFFNERLEYEKLRRVKFSESRRDNRLRKSHDPTYDEDMIPHMENENGIKTETGKVRNGGVGENLRKTEFLTNQKWKEEFCIGKKIDMPALEKLQTEFITDTELKEQYVDSYKRYFTNWFNLKHNGTHQQSFKRSSVRKSDGANELLDDFNNELASYKSTGE